jgi:hypothetical protein
MMIRSIVLFVMLGILALGCSSSPAPALGDRCGFVGTWTTSYTEKTGTCGAFPSGLLGLSGSDGAVSVDLSSSATLTASQFNEQTCQGTFAFSTVTTLCAAGENAATYTINVSKDGNALTGFVTLSGCNAAEDGGTGAGSGVTCASTYTLAATRF